jgi:hypothetical protein
MLPPPGESETTAHQAGYPSLPPDATQQVVAGCEAERRKKMRAKEMSFNEMKQE